MNVVTKFGRIDFMDKFVEMAQRMSKMSDEEKMEWIAEKKQSCTCPGCPSYNECALSGQELLYCSIGKSTECITEEKGCICPSCPMTEEMGLNHMYFCTKDSEKVQRGM